jgi:hypothetical protein
MPDASNLPAAATAFSVGAETFIHRSAFCLAGLEAALDSVRLLPKGARQQRNMVEQLCGKLQYQTVKQTSKPISSLMAGVSLRAVSFHQVLVACKLPQKAMPSIKIAVVAK